MTSRVSGVRILSDRAFGIDVDLAMLHKMYAGGQDGRYSPPVCIGCERHIVTGDSDPDHVSTSYVERTNLGMLVAVARTWSTRNL